MTGRPASATRPYRHVRRLAAALALVALAPAASVVADAGAADARSVLGDASSWSVAGAQAPGTDVRRGGTSRWTAVRVAKWTLLGATIGLGYYALKQSTRADRAYASLRHLCADVRGACVLSAGRYQDPSAEALYATSLRYDRRAQGGILGGQATLFGSAALFVYDLRNARRPENIPYPGVPPARQLDQSPRGAAGEGTGPSMPTSPFARRTWAPGDAAAPPSTGGPR